MSDVALTPEIVTEVGAKTSPLLRIAQALVIDSDDAYADAGEILKRCGAAIDYVNEKCEGVVRATHAAHKAATAQRAELVEIPTAAKHTIQRKMGDYWTEREAARLKAEREAALEQQRIADEQRRAAAESARAAGDAQTAELIAQDVGKPPTTPVAMPPTVQATPKLDGLTPRKNWRARVRISEELSRRALIKAAAEDERLEQYLELSWTPINKLARAQEASLDLPGFDAFNDVNITRTR